MLTYLQRKQKVQENNQRITTNSGKEQHTQRARKNGGKTRMCTFGPTIETRSHRQFKMLELPAILINFLPQYIEKGLTSN